MNSRSLVKSVAKLSPKMAGVKDIVLGKKYKLSLVFCGNSLSRQLNRTYRKKDKPTNVLSFPISKNSGEIFINKDRYDDFTTLYLFIHAVLHLKGRQHGAKMESEEKKLLKLFNGKTNLSRHRHRQSSR